METGATALGSEKLDIHDIEPVNPTGKSELVSNKKKPQKSIVSESYNIGAGDEDPTTDELHGPNALRRVSAPIPWAGLHRRLYRTTLTSLTMHFHFLPRMALQGVSGALGQGVETASAINTFNTFWCYCLPLVSAYIAVEYWGRYKTISWSIAAAILGHIILVISDIPPVITNTDASFGVFVLGVIIMGLGTGGFKPNISAPVVEQIPIVNLKVHILESGERVIIDPTITQSRIYHYFYVFINLGALMAIKTFFYCMRGRWHRNPYILWKRTHDGNLWDTVKSSNIEPQFRPKWMTFDDAWADEVRRGFAACAVFCWFPIYWLSYNQLTSNLTAQAGTMALNGVANDVLNNLDPLALLIFVPLCDTFLYSGLRKMGIRFTAIRKITLGFWLASFSMIWAAVIHVNPTSIIVWAQTGSYVLVAFSEIFAVITSMEYAYSKAPRNMCSLVQAINMFTNAISATIAEALIPLAKDPLLIWNYAVFAILTFVGGIIFIIQFWNLDKEEDELNNLPEGHVQATENRDS
ncbi:Major facilitator superfamily domain general substrate transporter [Penicillium fimorum]|uniref:Major facilitator superfamily domain general substrate transporter n=1 Tax=Penicillium fimorum TaxID=1882269 RepID=A0A9W9Y2K8_9EURO|nr:Major facilitator superfamily domain general substrate transporter [Penicillium fimorum]